MNKQLTVRSAGRPNYTTHVILIGLVLLSLYPLFFMVATAGKSNAEFVHNLFGVAWPYHWDNFLKAWLAIRGYVRNSALMSGTSVIMILLTAPLAGYVLARLRFRLNMAVYMAIVALMMIPSELTLIPLFLEIKDFGLLNSYWGLILAYAAGGQAFSIFVFRQSFAQLPEELFEAARIDGCSEGRALVRIVLPMTKPILATVALLQILGTWNAFLLPLVVLSNTNKFPITVGLLTFQSQYMGVSPQYGPLFAGYAIATIPLALIVVLAMRLFVQGIGAGAFKL